MLIGKIRTSSVAAALLLAAGSSGCVLEEHDGSPLYDEAAEELAPQAGPNGIISGNGALLLTPEIIALYTPVASLLTLTALTRETLQVNDLVGLLAGRAYLHYIVKCALPEGESITVDFLGLSHTFEGHIGIAPEWTTGALSPQNRRWLSACVLAHVNLSTASVPILLRGNHPALAPTEPHDSASFSHQEGAFYGDIFTLIPAMHACPSAGSLGSRVCTSSLLGLSPCGFLVPGSCDGAAGVCSNPSNGSYGSCRSSALPLLSTTYTEVITAHLAP